MQCANPVTGAVLPGPFRKHDDRWQHKNVRRLFSFAIVPISKQRRTFAPCQANRSAINSAQSWMKISVHPAGYLPIYLLQERTIQLLCDTASIFIRWRGKNISSPIIKRLTNSCSRFHPATPLVTHTCIACG